MRQQIIRLALLSAVTATGLCASQAYPAEDPGGWRLFDPAPLATVEVPTNHHPRPQAERASPQSRPSGHWLVFNGIVSSSRPPGSSNPDETLWINGYPYRGSVLPHGVKQINWRKELQVLEVKLSDGLLERLSPGERIELDATR